MGKNQIDCLYRMIDKIYSSVFDTIFCFGRKPFNHDLLAIDLIENHLYIIDFCPKFTDNCLKAIWKSFKEILSKNFPRR